MLLLTRKYVTAGETILDIRIWVRVLIEEPPLIEQTDIFVLPHLLVLHRMTDDTAHIRTYSDNTTVRTQSVLFEPPFRENVDSFAILLLMRFIRRIRLHGSKRDIPNILNSVLGITVS